MKVFVIGANGKIGKQLVGLLHQSDKHTVRAMVRDKEQREFLEDGGVEAILADLEHSTVEELADAAKGCDAIVFTAGSGPNTGADKTIMVDLDGAAKSIEAAEIARIKRYVMVSSIRSDNRAEWTTIVPYLAAKHHADKILMNSDLTYTIVRPGRLLEDGGTGKISIAGDLKRSDIPRADVAKVLYEVVDAENTFGQAFDLVSGETDIAEAVKNYK